MQNFDFLPLSTNVLIDEKVFSIYHLASSIATPVVGAIMNPTFSYMIL
jgi:hypothetical protein